MIRVRAYPNSGCGRPPGRVIEFLRYRTTTGK